MPRRHRTPGARSPRGRGRSLRANPAKELARMKSLALDIEEPLNDAADYVLALRLVGEGLIAMHDDTGRAVVTTAWAAAQRLEALREVWERMFSPPSRRSPVCK
jgi:hypothetical protein